jgi:hypothetical protein
MIVCPVHHWSNTEIHQTQQKAHQDMLTKFIAQGGYNNKRSEPSI